ncbi:hypothetical protein Mapa_008560 [Marchantia paleacea]|nr:hypothetical protein Mapa_008560 [Marchantia paleacea]
MGKVHYLLHRCLISTTSAVAQLCHYTNTSQASGFVSKTTVCGRKPGRLKLYEQTVEGRNEEFRSRPPGDNFLNADVSLPEEPLSPCKTIFEHSRWLLHQKILLEPWNPCIYDRPEKQPNRWLFVGTGKIEARRGRNLPPHSVSMNTVHYDTSCFEVRRHDSGSTAVPVLQQVHRSIVNSE